MILGALAGCDGKNDSVNKPLEETVKGIPLSVQVVGGTHSVHELSTVLQDSEGKYILANGGHYPLSDVTDGAALIESEMNDGDNESVELRGYRNGNRFKINSISSNGYTVDLK